MSVSNAPTLCFFSPVLPVSPAMREKKEKGEEEEKGNQNLGGAEFSTTTFSTEFQIVVDLKEKERLHCWTSDIRRHHLRATTPSPIIYCLVARHAKKKLAILVMFMANFLLAFTNNENSEMSYYISINTPINHNKNLINIFICIIRSADFNSGICMTCIFHRICQLNTESFLFLLRTNKS